jgi:hypothetical protein
MHSIFIPHVQRHRAKSKDCGCHRRSGAYHAAQVLLQQQLLTKFIEPFHLAPSSLGILRMLMFLFRQMAHQHTADQKCAERHPVVRLRDRQAPQGGQKEKVVEQCAENRQVHRIRQPPSRRRNQHQHQEAQGHGRWIRREDAPEYRHDQKRGRRQNDVSQQNLYESRRILFHERRSYRRHAAALR